MSVGKGVYWRRTQANVRETAILHHRERRLHGLVSLSMPLIGVGKLGPVTLAAKEGLLPSLLQGQKEKVLQSPKKNLTVRSTSMSH